MEDLCDYVLENSWSIPSCLTVKISLDDTMAVALVDLSPNLPEDLGKSHV